MVNKQEICHCNCGILDFGRHFKEMFYPFKHEISFHFVSIFNSNRNLFSPWVVLIKPIEIFESHHRPKYFFIYNIINLNIYIN